MAVPNRPVGGASIESAWGDAVHDVAVLARGVRVSGGSVAGGAGVKVALDTVLSGSAAMVDLASNEFIAPIDGVYSLVASLTCTGYTGGAYRPLVYTGAAVYAFIGASAPGAGATGIRAVITGELPLTAGTRVYIDPTVPTGGSGASPTYVLDSATFRLIAAALG